MPAKPRQFQRLSRPCVASTVAMWNEDGHVKIWTATQGSFTARQQVAELLQIPISRVTVTPCEIGGGFGGKDGDFPAHGQRNQFVRRDSALENASQTAGLVRLEPLNVSG